MGFLDFLKKKKIENSLSNPSIMFVEKLQELGYFKYTHDTDLEEIRSELIEAFSNRKYLGSLPFDHSPYNSKDQRYYYMDNEDLFEEGGFVSQLNTMKTIFNKMDFKLEINENLENWENENGLNHSITLNGKTYIIFENFNYAGWTEAAQRFADIINNQLELQKIEERLYLISSGNEGCCVYLTNEQFSFLDSVLLGRDKPKNISDWCEINKVERIHYI